MTAQKGKSLLLKVGLGDGPPETFQSVAGLKTKQVQLGRAAVDVTNADSAGGWRELIAAGTRTVAISGSGIFRDEASDERVRALYFDAEIANWQIVVPDFGTLEGPFEISALDYSGAYDGAMTFSLTLQSAGAIAYEALP